MTVSRREIQGLGLLLNRQHVAFGENLDEGELGNREFCVHEVSISSRSASPIPFYECVTSDVTNVAVDLCIQDRTLGD